MTINKRPGCDCPGHICSIDLRVIVRGCGLVPSGRSPLSLRECNDVTNAFLRLPALFSHGRRNLPQSYRHLHGDERRTLKAIVARGYRGTAKSLLSALDTNLGRAVSFPALVAVASMGLDSEVGAAALRMATASSAGAGPTRRIIEGDLLRPWGLWSERLQFSLDTAQSLTDLAVKRGQLTPSLAKGMTSMGPEGRFCLPILEELRKNGDPAERKTASAAIKVIKRATAGLAPWQPYPFTPAQLNLLLEAETVLQGKAPLKGSPDAELLSRAMPLTQLLSTIHPRNFSRLERLVPATQRPRLHRVLNLNPDNSLLHLVQALAQRPSLPQPAIEALARISKGVYPSQTRSAAVDALARARQEVV